MFVLWRTVTRSHFTPIMVTVVRSWARCFKIHLGCFSPPRGFIRYQQTVWKQYHWKVIWHPLKAQSSILENLREWGFEFQDIWVKFWDTQNNNKMLGGGNMPLFSIPCREGERSNVPLHFLSMKARWVLAVRGKQFYDTTPEVDNYSLEDNYSAAPFILQIQCIQIKCYHEIISIGHKKYEKYNLPWFRSLSW